MAITVVLADDHVIVRNGLKALLESEPEIEVIGEASDGKEAVRVGADLRPDVIIMDIRMPGMSGIEATKELHNLSVPSKCLILSMHDNQEYVLQAIECGAAGYLLKDSEKHELIKAIKEVAGGSKYFSSPVANILAENYLNSLYKFKPVSPVVLDGFDLTEKEKQILKHVVMGLSNKDIADKLGKSVRTVETQRFNLMKKLGVKNVVELINFAKENRLINRDYFK